MMLLQKLMILSIILTSAPFEYSNSHTVKEAAEAIQLLKGISLLISQQRNSALNHIGGYHKYFTNMFCVAAKTSKLGLV